MLTALSNDRPDRLPCQVHGWMNYYLKTYLGGCDWWAAYERFGMDYAIYVSPEYIYNTDPGQWKVQHKELGKDEDGNERWEERITTPKGNLHQKGARNAFTEWTTEYPIKNEADFGIWNQYRPIPVSVDLSPVQLVKERLGEKGIIRSHPFSPGQGSPWQSFCTLVDTEKAIYMAMDQPDFLHHALEEILKRTLEVTKLWKGTPADVVELGGGAGSSTVISPDMFREFCLPYDKRQVELFHEIGIKTVYHLCGGLMALLDMAVETGTDGLETMTPTSMGGDCDLAEASRRVGDKLFFIGGFDQNAGFEKGTPEKTRQLVFDCFESTKDHAGYILCPSDHFFFGDPANLKAFAEAASECIYS